jgi:hypothetical protein
MTGKITWFVIRYPSKESNEGVVMWEHEFDTEDECRMKCTELQTLFPHEDFEASDLPELTSVFEHDVQPVMQSEQSTKH